MIALSHFDVVRALEMNPLVAIAGLLALLYVLHSIRVLITRKPWRPKFPPMLRPLVLAALVANWTYLIAVGR